MSECQPTVRYRRLSSMYLPTVDQRLLKVIKPTVILSTSAQCQLQTSILRVFADIGPTLAQGKRTNGHFVNVSPPSATAKCLFSVYFPTLGQRWLKVSKPTVIPLSATDVYPLCICRHWANVDSR